MATLNMIKFDAIRVLEQAQRFAFARPPCSEGEQRAADLFAHELQRTGWDVESTDLETWDLATLVACRFAVWRGLVASPIRSRNVVGSFATASAAAVRVVVATPLVQPVFRSGPNSPTGIALLLELARTFPQTLHDRPEVRVVGVGGPPGAGTRSLIRSLRSTWPDKSTLLVVVLAPGHGRETEIGGCAAGLPLARRAAADLWIPARAVRRSRWPRLRPVDALVTLRGARREPPAQPAAILALAQLIEELALRWAKRRYDDRTAARSSQNPG